VENVAIPSVPGHKGYCQYPVHRERKQKKLNDPSYPAEFNDPVKKVSIAPVFDEHERIIQQGILHIALHHPDSHAFHTKIKAQQYREKSQMRRASPSPNSETGQKSDTDNGYINIGQHKIFMDNSLPAGKGCRCP